MTNFLRRWGALGGAALIGAIIGTVGLSLTRCDVLQGRVAARAARDTSVNGRLDALEAGLGEVPEIRARLRRLEAGQAAMLAWMAAVSPKLGVPPPPAPASYDPDSFPASCEGGKLKTTLAEGGFTR